MHKFLIALPEQRCSEEDSLQRLVADHIIKNMAGTGYSYDEWVTMHDDGKSSVIEQTYVVITDCFSGSSLTSLKVIAKELGRELVILFVADSTDSDNTLHQTARELNGITLIRRHGHLREDALFTIREAVDGQKSTV